MSPSKLTFYAILLFWWVICVTIAILATRLSVNARPPMHFLNKKPTIPVSPAAHPRFPGSMVKRHKLSEGCVACHQYQSHDDARLRGACCTRRKAESHSLYSRPPPQPPSLQIPDDQGGVNSNKAAASSKPNTYRSTPKARVKGNPFLRRVPGLNYTQDKPFSTPDPVLSVPQPLPSHFALSPHYLRNGNLTWLTVPPPPPLPPPNDARWSAPPLLAMAQ